jgi:chromosome segregation ATPase
LGREREEVEGRLTAILEEASSREEELRSEFEAGLRGKEEEAVEMQGKISELEAGMRGKEEEAEEMQGRLSMLQKELSEVRCRTSEEKCALFNHVFSFFGAGIMFFLFGAEIMVFL